MMAMMNKEDGDEVLLEFLLDISKRNGSKRCAEESIKIMDEFLDSQLLLSIIIAKSLKLQNLIPPHVIDFEVSVLSAMSATFTTCEKDEIPLPLQELFEGSDDEIINKVRNSRKISFAITQFVNAYYQYDLFENKYPEINKSL
jgi:hypothetical protein